ncbi:hypothetical protein D9757_001927 [Collybiopsis confluens]|uniref:Phytocyanin domain-containing protein n=1 Tax=Collybiopsis confluens TaxID=2823264 RepID=A0A8H5HXC4_9AGAR|nr:hypothetical protein D9757_001927 [Collybiopsis confluens]
MFAKSVILVGLFASAAVKALPQSGSSSSGYGSSSGYSGSSDSSGYSSGNSGYSSGNSGYSSGNSGYSSGNSGYSSGNSGYQSSDSSSMDSGCGSSDCGISTSEMMDSSTMMMDSSSTMMMDSSSTMMMDSSSTMMMDSTSTSTSSMSYSTPSYGSGGMSWGSDGLTKGYDGCVQQCIASFGAPGSYQATATSGSSGSYGTGSTITVIVAPSQGVFRYVPFAVNASVGDTIKFMWGGNNHTVTKSSELTPCNKTSDAPFASGTHDKDFVFTQVVNDTNPTFFYCGTPTHCQQGMFGIINPPSAFEAPTSVSGMMSSLMANDTDLSTYAAYTANTTAGSAGSSWGANIDMSSMPNWSHSLIAENVLFTRNVLAMNPDLMDESGSVNLGAVGSNPMMVPANIGQALADSSSISSSSDASSAATSSGSAASSTSSPSGAASSNGAISVASSKILVGATVLVATFFAL